MSTTDPPIESILTIAGLLASLALCFWVGWASSPAPLDFGCVLVRPVDAGQGVSITCPGDSQTVFQAGMSVLVRCQCSEVP